MKKHTLFALLVAIAVLVVFGVVREFQLTSWDDNINVSDHAAVASASAGGLGEIWRAPYANLYVPVAYTWLWAIAWIGKTFGGRALDPALFHGGNLLLHAASAVLVLRILRRLVANDRAALGGALLFALHPLQVESVAWVTEARGLVSAVLALVALDLWLAVAQGGERSAARGAIATVCFAAAMLAKPQAAALPLVAVILDRWVLGRSWRAVLPLASTWFALALVCVVLTKWQQGDATIRFVPPLWARPLVALDAVAFYLAKLAFPVGLAADYGRTPTSLMQSSGWWLTALVPIALGCALWLVPRRARWLACFGVFLAALSPALGLVPFGYQDISTVADRYAYLAVLGPALALAFGLAALAPHLRASSIPTWSVIAGLALVLGIASRVQVETWRDNGTLFARVLEVNSKSWKAHSNLAYAAYRRGQPNEAVVEYQKALVANPRHALAHQNLGLILLQLGQTDEGARHLRAALELDHPNAAVESALGSVLLVQNKPAEAEPFLRAAWGEDPTRLDARDNLGNALLLQGKSSEVVDLWRAVLREKETPEAHASLSYALSTAGDASGAIEELRSALRMHPQWPDAEADLAWLLAASSDGELRNGKEAVALAEHASSLTPNKSAKLLDTLAAAYAEAGRFDEAVRSARAAALAAKSTEAALVPRIEQRVQLYAAGHAYHGGQR